MDASSGTVRQPASTGPVDRQETLQANAENDPGPAAPTPDRPRGRPRTEDDTTADHPPLGGDFP